MRSTGIVASLPPSLSSACLTISRPSISCCMISHGHRPCPLPLVPCPLLHFMLLYLVRHGQSLFNAERRIQGQFDVRLSPFGERQSAALAAAFRSHPIDAVYSSPLARA